MLYFRRKYGEATTITFGLRETDGVALKSDAVCVDGDVIIMKDEGAEANVDADFVDEGQGYSLAFTATEMTAARIQGYIEDQGTPVWLGREFLIETDGHASAQHEVFPADIKQISGDSIAADNLESQYDATGLIGDTFPSTQSQVGNIGSATGGGFSFEAIGDNIGGAIKGVSFIGVETSGTYTDTEANDGIYHQIDDTGDTIDIIYQFNVGSNRDATEITFKGYLSGNNDTALIQAYDFIGSTWDTRETIIGQNGSINITVTPKLLSKHTGTGSDSGLVLIRILASAQSNPALFTDEFLVQANALATGIPNGSTITLDTATTNETFIGYAWNIDLNGQDISGSFIANAVSISGTGVIINGSPAILSGSKLDTCTLSAYLIAGRCDLSSTLTLVSTSGGVDDVVDLFNCVSGVKGTGSPVIDASGVTKTTGIQNRLYGGGCTYIINSYCTLSHESIIGGTITLTNAGGTAELRGAVKAFVVNSSGSAITNIVCTSGVPITVNGTGGIINIYGSHAGITDNSGATVTINDNGSDVTDKTGYALSTAGIAAMLNTIVDNTFNIAKSWGKRLRGIEEYQGYAGGKIYIDTTGGGEAGSDPYVNGVLDKAVDNLADALLISASVGINCFEVSSGSSLAFISGQDGKCYTGNNWVLALGGQSINGIYVHGSSISGIATAASTPPKLEDCSLNEATLPPGHYVACGLTSTVLAGAAGTYFFTNCESDLAGDYPSFDFNAAIGDVNAIFREYRGEIEYKNMGQSGTDVASVDGNGRVKMNANSIGGRISVQGHQELVNRAAFIAAGGTVNDASRFATDQLVTHVIGSDSDTLETLSDQIDSISAGIIVVGAGGSTTPSYAEEGEPEDIVQGDVINKPRYVTGDQSAKTIFFGAKIASGDASYAVGLIQCTVGVYNADNDQTSYLIPFVADDTKTVTPNTYKGEAEVRDANGTSNPVTADRFDLNVIGEIVT